MNKEIENKIWVCGNRTANQFLSNPYYICYDPYTHKDLDNINHLNKYWSEYVCQRYVYDNQLKSNIITFCHDIRLVKYTKIDVDRIKGENAVQYYYTWDDCYTSEYDKLGNRTAKDEELPDIRFRNIYHELVMKMGQPRFMYDDFIEYLHKQTIVPIESIAETASSENVSFITRECYSCTWDTFCEMQQFLLGYFDFVQVKYGLCYDKKRHDEFFLTTIVPHYRYQYEQANGELNFSHLLYQSKSFFSTIFNSDMNYGLSCRNNVYRLFSYNIELLISLFIYSRNHFMNPDCVY